MLIIINGDRRGRVRGAVAAADPVQYAKRMVGRKMYGGTSTYIPIKINMAGVIPIIFAASLLQVPTLIARFADQTAAWSQWIQAERRADQLAAAPGDLRLPHHLLLLLLHGDHLQPGRGRGRHEVVRWLHPGHPGGPPHGGVPRLRDHPDHDAGLALPRGGRADPDDHVHRAQRRQNIPFGGSSILIVVGVGLETVKQIESQLQQRHYEGFLR